MKTINLQKIKKIYHVGDVDVIALRKVNLVVEKGEFISIMGASGSGKSTLMNIIGCLDNPTSGFYSLDGDRIDKLNKRQLADIRNQKIGFVFQTFNLLARTTALENVELPLLYDRRGRIKNPRQNAISALERVGLGDRMHHEPSQLSGGQQQRVAIARALVNEPTIILADEPTGNLDTRTSVEVMKVLQELNNQGITIVLVTHETDIAEYSRRIITLRDGLKIEDKIVEIPRKAADDLKTLKAPQFMENGNGSDMEVRAE
jgi:putative ABC transport system ATP-binding protein